MNINNQEGSMSDFGAVNAVQPQHQDDVQQQLNIVNVDLNRLQSVSSIQPQDQYFEVVEKGQSNFGNTDELQKLMDRVMKKAKRAQQAPPPPPATVIKIPSSKIAQKLSKKEEEEQRKKREEAKRKKIAGVINIHVLNFKAVNRPNVSDNEVTRQRAQFKQKVFEALLYGIEELKLQKPEQLSDQQRQVTTLTGKGPYALAKTIVTELDVIFMKVINHQNRQTCGKKYKSFLKNFSHYLADPTNLELRRKVLAKVLVPKVMATMSQEDFFPAHIREKWIQKQNIILSEATAQAKPAPKVEDQYNEYQHQSEMVPEEPVHKKQGSVKPKYRFLDESNVVYIHQLLQQEQILKMRRIFEQDIRKDIQERLTNSINKVFDLAP